MTLQDTTIHQALKNWHIVTSTKGLLDKLHLFAKYYPRQTRCRREATNKILQSGLEALRGVDEPAATLLRKRFLDEEKIYNLSPKLNVSDKTLQRHQKVAITLLTKLIADMEEKLCQEKFARLLKRLPFSVIDGVIGMDEIRTQLVDVLTMPTASWLVAIEGMAGLGKTTLATTIARQMVGDNIFGELVWLTISPEIQPASLLSCLWTQVEATQPPEISDEDMLAAVRSRLETFQEIEMVLPLMRSLANPTKVLLTSRASLKDVPDVYTVRLPELTVNEALSLMRLEARLQNIAEVTIAGDADLQTIYAATGGNPLALKLVLSQLPLYGLNGVLQNLIAARGQGVNELYNRIYRQAWSNLDAASRSGLLALAATAVEGADLSLLARMSRLSEHDMVDVLDKLARISLIKSVGGLHERRFRIHSLTRTFLHHEIAEWQI